MAKLKIGDSWWTAPAEAEDGALVIVTGRRDMDAVIAAGKYNDRVEVTWRYGGNGMPDDDVAERMEAVTEALRAVFAADPVAVLTGIYTGAGERNWVFYTLSLPIFGRKLNEALASMPVLPLEFYAEHDPQWQEYAQLRETEIAVDDEGA